METTATKPGDALLRHYFVSRYGEISFVESFVAPGWYKVARLQYTGVPLDSKLVSFGALSKQTMFSNLREARGLAAKNAKRYEQLKEKFGQ
jgi:hypothetical protein